MTPPGPTALTRRQRVGVLLICSMSLLIGGLDVTAVNVALPSIGQQLDADLAWLQWSVSAFNVVMASLLLVAGSTADRFGRKRVLTVGLALFTAASVLCSVAPTVELLVVARVLQGAGASMLNPVAMSIITNTFTDPRERAQAVGVWGAAFGVSLALGPIVGGALVSAASWRWIFLINLPLGLLAIALVRRYVPESKAPRARRFDPVGQVLVAVLLASVTFGIIEAPEAGWTAPLIVGAFGAAVAALVALLAYEPRRSEPLVDLRFFRSVAFSCSIALSVVAFATFGGFLFLNTMYLQDVRGLSPVQAGAAVIPIAVMIFALSPVSGALVGRRGPRAPLTIAGAGFAASCLMLVELAPGTSMAWLVAAYALFGVAFGLVNAPITNAAVSGMPRAQAGVAAAIATTSRQFGQALGVAVVGAIAATGSGIGAADFVAATRPAWWTLTACGAAVLVLGVLATSDRARASAQRTASSLDPEAVPA
ncbi:DHA2 family efflux MFS transporter permease subunit [Conexibacter sp. SYSU D00693]|uniref:DHA2 family efflux MFS transporter permease subunit n=1 Tax=Conexibacter sp. SYSU D00693 TaxID=2812560 RepID=UPI001F11E7ED|nr:DHA2 family efflux MFS transporter permease subunit [Conexibacter sp. SYSU D00693]